MSFWLVYGIGFMAGGAVSAYQFVVSDRLNAMLNENVGASMLCVLTFALIWPFTLSLAIAGAAARSRGKGRGR